MIIVEGMDNSGKSTLGQYIAQRLGLRVQESEGPPRSDQEILDRIARYSKATLTLFVRHPLISNPIYDTVRPPDKRIQFSPELAEQLYQSEPLIIYCDPLERGLGGHELKPHDTPDHMNSVENHKAHLTQLYREWAIRRAHIVYRIGDDMNAVTRMARAYVNGRIYGDA